MAEVDEDPPEIFVVFFQAVIEGTDVGLIEKAQDVLFQLAAALAGDDFDQIDAVVYSFLDDPIQFSLNAIPPIVDVVEIEFQLCHRVSQVQRSSYNYYLASKSQMISP